MVKYSQLRKNAMILFLILITMCSLLIAPEGASAQIVYSYEDQSSAVQLPEDRPFIHGKYMVWAQDDEQQNQQIFYQNIEKTTTVKPNGAVWQMQVGGSEI